MDGVGTTVHRSEPNQNGEKVSNRVKVTSTIKPRSDWFGPGESFEPTHTWPAIR